MKTRFLIYAILFPMVVSSGQSGDIINRHTGQVSDSLRDAIYMKADSIARDAAREIDSIFEKPKYITLEIDSIDNPEWFKRNPVLWRTQVWMWRFRVWHHDTTFSHIDTIRIK